MNRIEDEIQTSLQEVVSIGNSASHVSSHSYQDPRVADESFGDFSDLQELSHKINMCLEMQTKVSFITKEIAEIIKRQA